MRKPGSKLRFSMRSPCTSRIRDEAKPPINAWPTSAGSAPAVDANHGVCFLRHLPRGLASDAAGRNQLLRNGCDVVQEQAIAGSQEVARHRTSHGAEPDESYVFHLSSLLSAGLDVLLRSGYRSRGEN